MLTLGFVTGPNGSRYLACAASHLTAFMGAHGGLGVSFSVNDVHPVDDAGNIAVRGREVDVPAPTHVLT